MVMPQSARDGLVVLSSSSVDRPIRNRSDTSGSNEVSRLTSLLPECSHLCVEHLGDIGEAERFELGSAWGTGLRVPVGFGEELRLQRLGVEGEVLVRAGREHGIALAGEAGGHVALARVAALAYLEG